MSFSTYNTVIIASTTCCKLRRFSFLEACIYVLYYSRIKQHGDSVCFLYRWKRIFKYYFYKFRLYNINIGRSQWPRVLRRRSVAARLLRSWVWIPPVAWIFVCCECCVLSGTGLCDELITRPEESYRLWCVVVCDLETSRMRKAWLGRSATGGGDINIETYVHVSIYLRGFTFCGRFVKSGEQKDWLQNVFSYKKGIMFVGL